MRFTSQSSDNRPVDGGPASDVYGTDAIGMMSIQLRQFQTSESLRQYTFENSVQPMIPTKARNFFSSMFNSDKNWLFRSTVRRWNRCGIFQDAINCVSWVWISSRISVRQSLSSATP